MTAKTATRKSTAPKTMAAKKGATKKPRAKPPRVYGAGPAIVSEAALAAALAALAEKDAAIAAMLAQTGQPPLRQRAPGLAGLVWIVVGQQVSTAAANAIYTRVAAAFPDFDAAALAGADADALRACGLSAPKARAIHAIAAAVGDGRLEFDALQTMAADEAHRTLCALHGIGPWTADIFLLFCLGHSDAFPAGDLALQEAARLALKLRARPDAKKLEKIAERWRPQRAVAARLLWAYYRVAKNRAGMALAEQSAERTP